MSIDHKNIFKFRPFEVSEVNINSNVNSPRPRSGHRITCDGNNLYCYGGYNPSVSENAYSDDHPRPTWTVSVPLFKELWSFCFASKKWKNIDLVFNTIPDELASNAMCMSGNSIMIHGGTGIPFGNKCSNLVYKYRTGQNLRELQPLTTKGRKPSPLYGQAVFVHNTGFYTVGGTNGYNYTIDIHRLDLQTLIWEPIHVSCGSEDEPTGRYRHEVAQDGNEILVLGGGVSERAFDLEHIPTFNLETRTWTIRKTEGELVVNASGIPLPRKCHSAVQLQSEKNDVFVIGGSDGISFFDDVWKLDVKTMKWKLMLCTKLPKPLHFHASAITPQGCCYTFGGISIMDNNTRRTNCLYKMWLCIPKLSEICWEALLHYNQNLYKIPKNCLLECGVPLDFVNRIE